MIGRRREIRALYSECFAGIDGVEIFGGAGDEDNCWLTSILVDPDLAGWKASELSAALAQDDIESRPLWKPMHLQPVFAGARSIVNGNAERLFETGVTLPSGSALSATQLERVVGVIRQFLAEKR
jgi:dTDP-4-amino-4,6-dideoxygalactose transaminase